MKRKLYSYQRWSSAVQSEGTTKARQAAAAEDYAKKHDLELVTITDAGISAFRSLNSSRSGALGKFLDAVDQGLIPNNAYLYVEALDRISRDEIDVALELFLGILRRGITLITGMDDKTYTSAGIKGNPIDLLTSILMFSRANEESRTKQKRTNGSALALIERFNKGLPTTIKAIGSHPWWIDASTNKYESVKRHPKYWQIAREAIEFFLAGKSVFFVVGYLNEKYPNQWDGIKRKNKEPSTTWNYANIRKLRTNPAVYGLREIKIDGQVKKLEGYYPALISEGEFLRLESIRETTKYLGSVGEKTRNNINLLSGMRIFRCGHCNSTMMAMKHGNSIRYLCEKGRYKNDDCRAWSLPGELVEHTLMLVVTLSYIDINRNGMAAKEDYTAKIADVQSTIQDCSERISRLTGLIAAGLGDVDDVVKSIRTLDNQKKHLVSELDVLTRKQILAQDNTFETLMMDFFKFAQWGVIKTVDHDYRNQLRDIVKSSIGEVKAWKYDRRLMISYQVKNQDEYFTFSAGTEPYEYIFYFGSPENLKESEGIELPEEVKKRILELSSYYDASMNKLSIAENLLKEVGYPELNGKMFWPKK